MKKYISISIAAFLILSFVYSANAQDFNDVSSYNISKDAIDFLQTNNVIQGYTDGTFKPDNRINRAEFTKILIATLVKNPTGSNCFTDVKNEWFAPYICTAKKLGYIGGYTDGSFKPGKYINFAEASKIIDKALDVKADTTGTKGEWFAGYVNGLAKINAIPSSVQFFDKNISRSEMAEIIWRVKEKKTDKVSQDYDSITQEFPTIKSCPALLEKFKAYQGYNYGYYPMLARDVIMEESAVGQVTGMGMVPSKSADAIAPSAAPVVADDFSTTNIQVEGVDEADIIKNDGKYIYIVKDGTIRIVESYPPAKMAEVGTIDFSDDNFEPSEMFVNGDQLVVIGQSSSPYYYGGGIMKSIMPRRPWQGTSTKVYTFDIKDRTNPKQTRKVEFDGTYSTSRRVGNNMYLVLNEYPNVWMMNDIDGGEDLLPMMKDGDKTTESMVPCGDIRYFPGFVVPNYLIVAGIPLDDATGAIDREVFLGNSNNVYSSANNLYVATNQTDYNYYSDWDWSRDHTQTLVFKFALNNGKVDFVDRGSVPGTILNQFSMDESGDNFRIATTINSWDSEHPSGNNVYVLDKDMKTIGSLEEIAPGERIYSTRFLGERLYMVTFKQIDPLFVISMSDPKNPTILGKLKIPGFSQYLHPYDANHIIGFGQSTETNQYGGTVTAGFQMALFDVSDVTNPKQKFVEYIGDSGTSSELLNNHKALLFDKEKELLGFPITINEKVAPADLSCNKYRYDTCPNMCQTRCIPTSCTVDSQGASNCTNDCTGPGSCTAPEYDQYTTTFSGALVYTLNSTTGFKERGRITHYKDADTLKMGDYWPYDYYKAIERIIYMGDYLYTISQSRVMANALKTVDFVKSIDLK